MPQKWLRDLHKREWLDHRERVKTCSPYIDTSAPREMPHSSRNATARKKKMALIDLDNSILHDRLQRLAEEKNQVNDFPPSYQLKSLRADEERMKQAAIDFDNMLLHERLINMPPVYSVKKWNSEMETLEQIRKNMSEYPDYYEPRYIKVPSPGKNSNNNNNFNNGNKCISSPKAKETAREREKETEKGNSSSNSNSGLTNSPNVKAKAAIRPLSGSAAIDRREISSSSSKRQASHNAFVKSDKNNAANINNNNATTTTTTTKNNVNNTSSSTPANNKLTKLYSSNSNSVLNMNDLFHDVIISSDTRYTLDTHTNAVSNSNAHNSNNSSDIYDLFDPNIVNFNPNLSNRLRNHANNDGAKATATATNTLNVRPKTGGEYSSSPSNNKLNHRTNSGKNYNSSSRSNLLDVKKANSDNLYNFITTNKDIDKKELLTHVLSAAEMIEKYADLTDAIPSSRNHPFHYMMRQGDKVEGMGSAAAQGTKPLASIHYTRPPQSAPSASNSSNANNNINHNKQHHHHQQQQQQYSYNQQQPSPPLELPLFVQRPTK